jgi:hypothetical protein
MVKHPSGEKNIMSKIYLINVGANSNHSSVARIPLFEKGTFMYVSFPHSGLRGVRPYPAEVRPFVRGIDFNDTHFDPDWENLTYGDGCDTPRAGALKRVVENDVLLFWGLFWINNGGGWDGFTGERRWCLMGALRVREILEEGQRPTDAKSPSRIERARHNVHFCTGGLDQGNRVFLGCTRRSQLFPFAVDLEVGKRTGLLYRTIQTASGGKLSLGGKPAWSSSLRSCRVVWDLDEPKSRKLAEIARDRIYAKTGYDLLSGI